MTANLLDADLVSEVQAFLLDEAELLDTWRFDEWLDLFAADGRYWMPWQLEQTDPLGVPSIFYEDKDVLSIRFRRVGHPANLAQCPAPRTSHILSAVRLERIDGPVIVARSRMVVVEYREGDGQRIFGACCRHTLRRENDALKIVLKRVDLANSDAPHTFMTVPI